MQLHRFYCAAITRPQTELTGSEAHHLAAVLRLTKGQQIELFDGKGNLAKAAIISMTSQRAQLQVKDIQTIPQPFTARIVIAAGVVKGRRFDRLIGKCTELGVDRITPLLFERTVKQPGNLKILQRWNNIAISAAKQSRRLFLPHIDAPLALTQAMENLRKDLPQAQILFGSLSKQTPAVIDQPFTGKDYIVFVGPEGGMTKDEEKLLQTQNAHPVRLTDTILRAETAALAFAAILTAKRTATKD